jgi:4-hydroxysphinganine ceramide fatty acyl 2-hydroxylase
METALKIYWSHKPNWLYAAVSLAGLAYILSSGALLRYWYLPLVLLALVPFIEYFTHKYLLHMPQPKNADKHPIWAFVAHRVHYLHHEDPKKVAHIFAEVWVTLPALLVDALLVWLVTWNLEMTAVFMTAGVAYFLYYEWVHFIAHYDGYTPRSAYGRFLKKYHLWHHYKNEAFWYGVTNPAADWFFGRWKDPHAVTASGLALDNRRKRAAKR